VLRTVCATCSSVAADCSTAAAWLPMRWDRFWLVPLQLPVARPWAMGADALNQTDSWLVHGVQIAPHRGELVVARNVRPLRQIAQRAGGGDGADTPQGVRGGGVEARPK
jgi:hypothetical protein